VDLGQGRAHTQEAEPVTLGIGAEAEVAKLAVKIDRLRDQALAPGFQSLGKNTLQTKANARAQSAQCEKQGIL